MRRSIKTKLIWALTTVITVALIIGGGLLIWQNMQQMREEIYLDTLTFAELTNDRIVTSYEQFYVTENFLQFRKDVNPSLSKNVDIRQIEIIGKSGELFYDSDTEPETAYVGESRQHTYDVERSRDIKPSLLFSDGTVVYVKKNASNEWLAVNANEELIEFPKGEVVNIFYPHNNARLTIVYSLTYEAFWARIFQMVLSILGVISLSIVVVSFLAIFIAGKFVRPIKALEQVVVAVGEGKFGSQVKMITDDEIGVLAETFNKMSQKLKRDTEQLVEKESIEKELSIAGEIQQNMLPKKAPQLKSFDISGSLTPATSIGGDIYDYLQSENFGTYVFIADVTGHGVAAGMVANITHSSLYSFSKVFEQTDQIMKSMNSVIHAKSKTNMFATALLAHLDEQTRQIKFCNAGHEQMIYYNAAKDELKLVGKGGMALGMVPDLEKVLKEEAIEFQKGDVLMLYTDGIPEAWKSKKINLGMDEFIKLATEAIRKGGDARGIRKRTLDAVNRFRADYPQQDDITLVVLKGK